MIPVWLASSALAWECSEVVNMAEAGMPAAEIVARLDASRWGVDARLVSCLRERTIDPAILRKAEQVARLPDALNQPLAGTWSAGSAPRVSVDLVCGLVRVRGSGRSDVQLTGRTATRGVLKAAVGVRSVELALVDGLSTDTVDATALPRVDAPALTRRPAEAPCGVFELAVPYGSSVLVRSTRADVDVRWVDGAVDVTSHFGDIDVLGQSSEVVLRTTSGAIRSDTGASFATVQTVDGLVELGAGADARVEVSSISGPVWLWGGPLRRASVDTMSGDVHLNATVASGGHVSLVTHKGRVEAVIPPGTTELASHMGRTVDPPAPPSATSRAPFPGDRFTGAASLPIETRGLWTRAVPERWWWGSGAVLAHTLPAGPSDFTLQATSFSGDVVVRHDAGWPGPTGPILQGIQAASGALDACADAQLARHPGVSGHAVARLVVLPDGRLEKGLTAPSTAWSGPTGPTKVDAPRAVADGLFSACVVRALAGLTFPPGGRAEVRWPVVFEADPAFRALHAADPASRTP